MLISPLDSVVTLLKQQDSTNQPTSSHVASIRSILKLCHLSFPITITTNIYLQPSPLEILALLPPAATYAFIFCLVEMDL
jgi:hypothetical protein